MAKKNTFSRETNEGKFDGFILPARVANQSTGFSCPLAY